MRHTEVGYRSRLRALVELEFERFLQERSMQRSQQSIVSFAIEMTKADTQEFLNVLKESEIILFLGGRASGPQDEKMLRILGIAG
jgi:hypothetical protein